MFKTKCLRLEWYKWNHDSVHLSFHTHPSMRFDKKKGINNFLELLHWPYNKIHESKIDIIFIIICNK